MSDPEAQCDLLIARAMDCLTRVRSPDHSGLTCHFLQFCITIRPLIGVMGGVFDLLAVDIMGITLRLSQRYNSNKVKFEKLRALVEDELETFLASKPEAALHPTEDENSFPHGILWLKRDLKFLVDYFEKLSHHQVWDRAIVSKAYNDAYEENLGQWHGCISRSNYKIGGQIIDTERSALVTKLIGAFRVFEAILSPLFEEINAVLGESSRHKVN